MTNSDNADGQRSHRGRWAMAVALVVVVGILVGGYAGLRWYFPGVSRMMRHGPLFGGGAPVEGGLDEISEMMDIKFPPHAELTDSYLSVWFGPTLFARIEMPAGEMQTLIAAIPEPKWRSTTERFDIPEKFLQESWQWWRPYETKKFVAIRAHLPLMQHNEQNRLEMVIDTGDESVGVVYLYWSAE